MDVAREVAVQVVVGMQVVVRVKGERGPRGESCSRDIVMVAGSWDTAFQHVGKLTNK